MDLLSSVFGETKRNTTVTFASHACYLLWRCPFCHGIDKLQIYELKYEHYEPIIEILCESCHAK